MALITVTNLNDSGAGSLRQAINVANLGPATDTIEFAASIVGGTTAGVDDGRIVLAGTQLVISNDITINGDVDGDGKSDITISANNASRVAQVVNSGTEAKFYGLTLEDGNSGSGFGGAVLGNAGTVLNFVSSTIQDSTTTTRGGGVYSPNAFFANTTVSGNSANFGGGFALGYVGTGTVVNSTFSDNYATSAGGGIDTLTNSDIDVVHSTITNNSIGAANGYDGSGVALYNGTDGTFSNTIVSGNTGGTTDIASTGLGPTVLNAAYNLFGTAVAVTGTNGGGNQFTNTPGLGALADNGGPVQTHAVLTGSQAISGGNASLLSDDVFDLDGDTDTGEDWPLDSNGNARVLNALDIGAVEYVDALVDTLSDVVDGDYSAGNLSLREALSIVGDGGTITFDAGITGGTTAGVNDGVITLGGTQLEITQDVTINGDVNGDDKADITISANDASRVVEITGSGTEATFESLTFADGNAGASGSLFGGAIYGGSGTSLTLVNSTVRDSNAYSGGGISAREMLIVNSTIANNTATSGGGGLSALLSGVDVIIVNSTLTGNTAGYSGGAIDTGQSVFLDIYQSTIVGNTVLTDIPDNGGGGISVSFASSAKFYNNIIAGNTGGTADIYKSGMAVSGVITAQNNLLGIGSEVNIDNGGNQFSDMPALAALADNGGPVETRSILPGSLAIGGGDAAILAADLADLDGDANDSEDTPLDSNLNARVSGTDGLDLGAVEFDDFAQDITTTGVLTIGGSVTGDIEFNGDEDWFAVTLAANTTYNFLLEGVDGSGGTLPDPVINSIYDSAGTLIPGTFNDDIAGFDSGVIFTPTTAGTYYIAADGLNANTGTYTLSSIEGTLPDLVTQNLSLNTTTFAVGDNITANFDAANIGGIAPSDGDYGLYLSTDNIITTSDTFIGFADANNINAPGSTEALSISAAMPSVASGTYFLGVFADDFEALFESDETNNVSAAIEITVIDPATAVTLLDASDVFVNSFGTIAAAAAAAADDFTIEVDAATYAGGFEAVVINDENLTIDLDAGLGVTATLSNSPSVITLTGAGDGQFSFVGNGEDNVLTGSNGADSFTGGGGEDTLRGLNGNDTLIGGDEIDLLIGGIGNDVINGDDGDDRLRGNSGLDTITGGEGNDRIDGASGGDLAMGDLGDDTVEGEGGNDDLNGGMDNDIVRGGGGFDTVAGDDGNDRVEGNAGDDIISGGGGMDTLSGGGGADTMSGGTQDDVMNGNSGDDLMMGDADNDNLNGGSGEDTLDGGTGNDTLTGGRDDDELTGGTGVDTFIFGNNSDSDVVLDFEASIDTLAIDDNLYLGNLSEAQVVAAFASNTGTGVLFDFQNGDTIEIVGVGVDTTSIVADMTIV